MRVEQIVGLHRLADVIVEAGLQRALPVFAPRVGRDGNGPHVPALAVGQAANRAHQRVAILSRHRDVGQDDVGPIFRIDPQRFGRAARPR